MREPVYLDWNATTPLRDPARQAWLQAQAANWGNPASVHRCGQAARLAWDQAMSRAAACLGCRAHELVLTSGGTEANATAIASAAYGGAAVASVIEHSSVLRNLERYAAGVTLIGVDAAGRIDPAALCDACDHATRLICLQYANNELGTIQDLAGLIPLLRAAAPQALILVDACQGIGKEALDVAAWGVDLVTAAGHKFGAPRGTGLLYVRTGRALTPLIAGGRQQEDRRSGSEDLAGLLALVAALEQATAEAPEEASRQRGLLENCFAEIRRRLPAARWLAADAPRLACTLSLAHPAIDGESLVARLDLAGFACSRASACMARSGEPSHVVAALGLDPALARGVIRVSIGRDTSSEALTAFAEAYCREVTAMLAAA